MTSYLDPEKILQYHPTARKIIERLRSKNWQTVIVGGAVRDLLREKLDPQFELELSTKDIDIATAAPVDRIKSILKDLKTLEIGEKFGVIMVIDPGKENRTYEIAQFRKEKNYDGRKPGEVEHAPSLREDLNRRDFTVNGMALNIDGELIDPFNGEKDLQERKIRAIRNPEQRFLEDHLRMIRAIRFACHLDGKIEGSTFMAIKEHAEKIENISWERISEELFKILDTERSAKGIELMDESNLLKYILPELTENKGVDQKEEYHPEGDVFDHSLKALSVADKLSYRPLLKLATLLHDIGKGRALKRNRGNHMGGHEEIGSRISESIGERLRLPRAKINRLSWIVLNHMRCAKLPLMKKAKKVQIIRHNSRKDSNLDDINEKFGAFADLIRILIADSQASAHQSEGWLPAIKEFTSLLPHLRDLDRRKDARELLNGNDLLKMGMEEGPMIGEILEKIHHKFYAGEIVNRNEALEEARKLVKEAGVD